MVNTPPENNKFLTYFVPYLLTKLLSIPSFYPEPSDQD